MLPVVEFLTCDEIDGLVAASVMLLVADEIARDTTAPAALARAGVAHLEVPDGLFVDARPVLPRIPLLRAPHVHREHVRPRR